MTIPTLLLFSLVACGDKDPDTPSTDSDPQGSTDTGEPSGDTGEPAETYECLEDHGIASANSFWIYAWQNSGRTGGRNAEVVGYDPDAGTATVKTTDQWTDGQSNFYSERFESFVCGPEGIYLAEVSYEYSGSTAGQGYDGAYTTVYDPPGLVRTNTPTVGDSWTSTWTGTKTEDGFDEAIDTTSESEVLDDGIPLSGGWEGTQIRDYASADVYSDYHWMHEVGVIRTPTAYITSYTP